MATKKVASKKRYLAWNEFSANQGVGYSTMEGAVEGGDVDDDRVVIFELVRVGTFERKDRITLNKIK